MSQRHQSQLPLTPVQKTSKEEGNPRTAVQIRRMSPAELKERHEKGLCYNYIERFVLGHKCKKLFLIDACFDEEDGDVIMAAQLAEEAEVPRISLHAISGFNAP